LPVRGRSALKEGVLTHLTGFRFVTLSHYYILNQFFMVFLNEPSVTFGHGDGWPSGGVTTVRRESTTASIRGPWQNGAL
jgi:hypothetical protein